jgi:hypothetical protein
MATDIITNYSTENLAQFKKQVTASAQNAPVQSFKPIIKFTKAGDWVLGKDRDEITPGTRLVVFGPSMQEGWLGWQNGKVVGEKMRPISGTDVDDIEREEIAKIAPNDGWYRQIGLEMKFQEGPDKLQVLWKASTAGARDTFYRLVRSIAGQFLLSEEYVNPVITLDRSSYQHQTYGTIYKPELTVVDWMSFKSDQLYSVAEALELEKIDVNNMM